MGSKGEREAGERARALYFILILAIAVAAIPLMLITQRRAGMSKPVEVDIASAFSTTQLVDSDGVNCGKVDDLELTGLDTDSPEVVEILVGGKRVALPRPAGAALRAFRRRCRARALVGGRVGFGGREAEAARCGACA